MSNKADKLKARLPRGLSDRMAGELRATEKMLATIRRVYERYGFEPVETPLIEYTDALGKFLPDQDRPNEGVFSFQDDDEQWLSLRYDLTAPLARYVAENYERLPKPYRSYRAGWVFRNEKPGPGRFRQFMQFDADTVGASSPAADAEICMMAADTLTELGVPAGQFMVKVNSRRVLDGVMEAAGIADAHKRLTVLRAIDKFDRLGIAGVRDLLGAGRKDESGDFTKGAGLAANQVDLVTSVLADDGGAALGEALARSATGAAGRDELATIGDLVKAAGYRDRVQIDPSVVRGLEYYTGAVFEAQLTFEVPNEKGQPVVFGSVGGGGRYDGLVGRFMKDNVPATGFSVGVSRLAAALAAIGKLDTGEGAGPVVVLVMDKARLADYQRMVATLRAAGVPAEMYLGDSGMRAQMKYADRRNSPVAVIQGEDEKARGVVQLKDLVEGARIAAGISGHDEYREARPGQVEVAESQLVAEVKALLGREPLP
jgi:histidyl-tRNA synthetase